MISHLEIQLRRAKRLFSRNRFVVWLFGMSTASDTNDRHGLIILQVDGLSRPQLEAALSAGSMPFTRSLLNTEHYKHHSLYSGVPSSTPAAQGELFYGVRQCVPAFRFMRPGDARPVTMLEPGVAAVVQESLADKGQSLLMGGSAFSDIFSGGADESSFCATSIGWGGIIPSGNIFKMLIFAILNFYSLIRVSVLIIVELLLSLVDFVRGVYSGRNFFKEISFIPIRVATSILLRELVTIGVKLDAARGLPVIHANFLAYDEQAHRRGPQSKFAHWSLRGVDKAISRIWRSAKLSEHLDYEVWIYSDHGQEQCRSYPVIFQRTIQQAIDDVLVSHIDPESEMADSAEITDDFIGANIHQSERVHLIGSKKLTSWFSSKAKSAVNSKFGQVNVAAMGPLGFIYLGQRIAIGQLERIAGDLVANAHVPMVLLESETADNQREVNVFMADGKFHLPADKEHILGKAHPFLDDACKDLIALCKHPYAGEITISGWTADQQPMSFRIENGSHAGPGYHETHAFALLPQDTWLSGSGRSYLRLKDLYRAGMRFRGQMPASENVVSRPFSKSPQSIQPTDSFRVMTYNIHSCTGMDGKIVPARIARVIAMYQPDVIALQELEVGLPGSGHMDQAQMIADELNMDFHFHPIKSVATGHFGNAILTRHPMRNCTSRILSTNVRPMRKKLGGAPFNQARGAMQVEIDFKGFAVKMVTTHLGLTPEERRTQIVDLLGEPWFYREDMPAILCGDFNASPNQRAYREVSRVMDDVQTKNNAQVPQKTFPSRYPTLRIDHMFVDKKVQVSNVMVPVSHLTKIASDHLPLIADLDLSTLGGKVTSIG